MKLKMAMSVLSSLFVVAGVAKAQPKEVVLYQAKNLHLNKDCDNLDLLQISNISQDGYEITLTNKSFTIKSDFGYLKQFKFGTSLAAGQMGGAAVGENRLLKNGSTWVVALDESNGSDFLEPVYSTRILIDPTPSRSFNPKTNVVLAHKEVRVLDTSVFDNIGSGHDKAKRFCTLKTEDVVVQP